MFWSNLPVSPDSLSSSSSPAFLPLCPPNFMFYLKIKKAIEFIQCYLYVHRCRTICCGMGSLQGLYPWRKLSSPSSQQHQSPIVRQLWVDLHKTPSLMLGFWLAWLCAGLVREGHSCCEFVCAICQASTVTLWTPATSCSYNLSASFSEMICETLVMTVWHRCPIQSWVVHNLLSSAC